jgi:hypothetical protein
MMAFYHDGYPSRRSLALDPAPYQTGRTESFGEYRGDGRISRVAAIDQSQFDPEPCRHNCCVRRVALPVAHVDILSVASSDNP